MRRITGPAAALLVGLAGCPLPQAVPEPNTSGGAYGPRIAFELLSPQSTFVDVGTTCTVRPQFALSSTVTDRDQQEAVQARWFEDYDPSTNFGIYRTDVLAGNQQDFLRPVPEYVYRLDDWQAARATHVVELVVSNNFKELDRAHDALPNRMPETGFDSQSFRWVFRYVAGGACPCDGGGCN